MAQEGTDSANQRSLLDYYKQGKRSSSGKAKPSATFSTLAFESLSGKPTNSQNARQLGNDYAAPGKIVPPVSVSTVTTKSPAKTQNAINGSRLKSPVKLPVNKSTTKKTAHRRNKPSQASLIARQVLCSPWADDEDELYISAPAPGTSNPVQPGMPTPIHQAALGQPQASKGHPHSTSPPSHHTPKPHAAVLEAMALERIPETPDDEFIVMQPDAAGGAPASHTSAAAGNVFNTDDVVRMLDSTGAPPGVSVSAWGAARRVGSSSCGVQQQPQQQSHDQEQYTRGPPSHRAQALAGRLLPHHTPPPAAFVHLHSRLSPTASVAQPAAPQITPPCAQQRGDLATGFTPLGDSQMLAALESVEKKITGHSNTLSMTGAVAQHFNQNNTAETAACGTAAAAHEPTAPTGTNAMITRNADKHEPTTNSLTNERNKATLMHEVSGLETAQALTKQPLSSPVKSAVEAQRGNAYTAAGRAVATACNDGADVAAHQQGNSGSVYPAHDADVAAHQQGNSGSVYPAHGADMAARLQSNSGSASSAHVQGMPNTTLTTNQPVPHSNVHSKENNAATTNPTAAAAPSAQQLTDRQGPVTVNYTSRPAMQLETHITKAGFVHAGRQKNPTLADVPAVQMNSIQCGSRVAATGVLSALAWATGNNQRSSFAQPNTSRPSGMGPRSAAPVSDTTKTSSFAQLNASRPSGPGPQPVAPITGISKTSSLAQPNPDRPSGMLPQSAVPESDATRTSSFAPPNTSRPHVTAPVEVGFVHQASKTASSAQGGLLRPSEHAAHATALINQANNGASFAQAGTAHPPSKGAAPAHADFSRRSGQAPHAATLINQTNNDPSFVHTDNSRPAEPQAPHTATLVNPTNPPSSSAQLDAGKPSGLSMHHATSGTASGTTFTNIIRTVMGSNTHLSRPAAGAADHNVSAGMQQAPVVDTGVQQTATAGTHNVSAGVQQARVLNTGAQQTGTASYQYANNVSKAVQQTTNASYQHANSVCTGAQQTTTATNHHINAGLQQAGTATDHGPGMHGQPMAVDAAINGVDRQNHGSDAPKPMVPGTGSVERTLPGIIPTPTSDGFLACLDRLEQQHLLQKGNTAPPKDSPLPVKHLEFMSPGSSRLAHQSHQPPRSNPGPEGPHTDMQAAIPVTPDPPLAAHNALGMDVDPTELQRDMVTPPAGDPKTSTAGHNQHIQYNQHNEHVQHNQHNQHIQHNQDNQHDQHGQHNHVPHQEQVSRLSYQPAGNTEQHGGTTPMEIVPPEPAGTDAVPGTDPVEMNPAEISSVDTTIPMEDTSIPLGDTTIPLEDTTMMETEPVLADDPTAQAVPTTTAGTGVAANSEQPLVGQGPAAVAVTDAGMSRGNGPGVLAAGPAGKERKVTSTSAGPAGTHTTNSRTAADAGAERVQERQRREHVEAAGTSLPAAHAANASTHGAGGLAGKPAMARDAGKMTNATTDASAAVRPDNTATGSVATHATADASTYRGGGPASNTEMARDAQRVTPATADAAAAVNASAAAVDVGASAPAGPADLRAHDPARDGSDDESDDEEVDEDGAQGVGLYSQHVAAVNRIARVLSQQQAQSPAGPRGTQKSQPSQLQETQELSPKLPSFLPEQICAVYREKGMTKDLYPWQVECLSQPGVLRGKNLVYCAPTSGGKSLVAEILMLRRILTTGRPCMLVLPFVALCAEKAAQLDALLAPMKRTVRGFYGGTNSSQILTFDTGVIVCTIEKANTLVNRLLEEESLNQISCVVVDELHMVGDDDRGYLLELLLTKLRYTTLSAVEEDATPLEDQLQIVGMSATMPNVEAVANWLGAVLYQTSFRPVPLVQYLKVGKSLRNESGQVVRELAADKAWEKQDPDHVALLCQETISDGHSVLIFCASKAACEACAKHVAKLIDIPERKTKFSSESGENGRENILAELKRTPGGVDGVLGEVMAKGCAFHHAGLTSEERELVERAFRCGAISVLTATSTLAAGVNLPARRVIFRHPYVGIPSNMIDGTRYRQMSGRAGRAGIDTHGEAILLATGNVSVARLEALMQEAAKPIESCLTDGKRGMKRAMLEVVASGAVCTPQDVQRYIKCTLLAAMNDFQDVVAATTIASLKWLGEHEFIRWSSSTQMYQPTALGKAALSSGMPPEQCLLVRQDLSKARQSFVMATDLHLTYLVTPVNEDLQVDWHRYYEIFQKLSQIESRVAELVGVRPKYIMDQHMGAIRKNATLSAAVTEVDRIVRRFYAALVLNDLIQEVTLEDVVSKYNLQRGPLQGLQERAGKFAAMVAAFCERLGWSDMEMLIAKFQGRVWFGVKPEIVALTEIPYVKGHRARLLYKAGLRTPEAVAAVDVDKISEILFAGAPHGGIKGGSNEQQRRIERRAARMILQGARDLLAAKAKELKAQAAAVLEAIEVRSSQLPPTFTAAAADLKAKILGTPGSSSKSVPRTAKTPLRTNTQNKTKTPNKTKAPNKINTPNKTKTPTKSPGGGKARTPEKLEKVTAAESGMQQAAEVIEDGPPAKRQKTTDASGAAGSNTDAAAGIPHLHTRAASNRPQDSAPAQPLNAPTTVHTTAASDAVVDRATSSRAVASSDPNHPPNNGPTSNIHPPPSTNPVQNAAGSVPSSSLHAAGSSMGRQQRHSMAAIDTARNGGHPGQQSVGRAFSDVNRGPDGLQQGSTAQLQGMKQQPMQQPNDTMNQQPATAPRDHISMQQQHKATAPSTWQQQQQGPNPSAYSSTANTTSRPHVQSNHLSNVSHSGHQQQSAQRPHHYHAQQPPGRPPQQGSYDTGQAHSGQWNAQQRQQPAQHQQPHTHTHQQPHSHPHPQPHTGYVTGPNTTKNQSYQVQRNNLSYGRHSVQQQNHNQGQQRNSCDFQQNVSNPPGKPHPQRQQQNTVPHQASAQQHQAQPQGQQQPPQSHLQQNTLQAHPQQPQQAHPQQPQQSYPQQPQQSYPQQPQQSHPQQPPQSNPQQPPQSHPQQPPQSHPQQPPQSHPQQPPQSYPQQPPQSHPQQPPQSYPQQPPQSYPQQPPQSYPQQPPQSYPQQPPQSYPQQPPQSHPQQPPQYPQQPSVQSYLQQPTSVQSCPQQPPSLQLHPQQPPQSCPPQSSFQSHLPPPRPSTVHSGGQLPPQLQADGHAQTAKDQNTAVQPPAQGCSLNTAARGIAVIQDEKQMAELAECLKAQSTMGFCLDVQTPTANTFSLPELQLPNAHLSNALASGSNPAQVDVNMRPPVCIEGMAISIQDGSAFYISFMGARAKKLLPAVRDLMQCTAFTKLTFSWKQQLTTLQARDQQTVELGLKVACPIVDVRIAAWLFTPDCAKVHDKVGAFSRSGRKSNSKVLEELLEKRAAHQSVMTALQGLATGGKPSRYLEACKIAVLSRKLYLHLLPFLTMDGLLDPLNRIEMPLVDVLVEMEQAGVAVDPLVLAAQKGPLQRRVEELERAAQHHAGCKFNLGSPKEVSFVLFEVLKLPVPPGPSSAKEKAPAQPSTKAEVLQELLGQHPVPALILEHRKLSKLLSGFVESLAAHMHRVAKEAQAAAGEGSGSQRPVCSLRGEFLHTATATGRLAMDDPNLQTIPKPVQYQVLPSQDPATQSGPTHKIVTSNIRSAFVAPPGWVLVSADYCQLELRLMAHFSGDSGLCSMLADGNDPFRLLAAQWVKCSPEQVTPDQRNHAKRLAYGLLYGMGPMALSAELGVTVSEAAQLSESFRQSLPSVDSWLKQVVTDCRANQYIQTLGGRRRYLPHIRQSGPRSSHMRAQAERQAVNSVCQGSAADLVKLCMIKLHQLMHGPELEGKCKLVLQVHDELLFEVLATELPQVLPIVRSAMEDTVKLSVPVPVKLHVGPSWGELTEWK